LIGRRGLLWYLGLAAANVLLLWGIVNVWWGGEMAQDPSRARQGPELPQVPNLRDAQPLAAFRVISAKDLFSPDRVGPEAGVAKKAPSSLEGGQLLGIIIVGSEKAALIGQPTARGPQQVQVVRPGEEFGGFKVTEISNDGVVFQGKAGKKTLGFPE
jgi:hypothetical protein